MLIAIFLVSLLAISAVSANELNTIDDAIANGDTGEISIENDDELGNAESFNDLEIAENDILSATHSVSGNTFTDIQNAVNSANEHDTIQISGHYAGNGDEIIIKKALTIIGTDDATLDAKKSSRIFNVESDGVIFKNLNIINAVDTAISSNSKHFKIYESNFKDCYGDLGGAVHIGEAYKCSFTNCSAVKGGAIYLGSAVDCTFTSCFAEVGGAIHGSSMYGSSANRSSFIRCFATLGCVIDGVKVDNCIFEACGDDSNGVIDDSEVCNSVFRNCDDRAVIYSDATNCTFINCNRAFFDMGNGHKVINSTFIDCGDQATHRCIAMYCIFKGNSKPSSDTKVYRHCKIVLSQTGTYYGDKKLTANVIDTDSNVALGGVDLKITFNTQNTALLTTNINGIASYDMPFVPGSYNAKASIYDNSLLDCREASLNNIAISKTPAVLSAGDLTTTYRSGKCFQIKAVNSENGKAIPNVKLSLKVFTGNKYKTVGVTTDSDGVAQYDGSALSVGKHKIVVSNDDTGKCSAGTKTNYIKVNKASYKINAPKTVGVLKKSRTFKVTVKNKASGNAVKGVKVTIKVYTGKKYKKFTKTTNGKGEASINTKSFSKGLHNVVISINANSNYNKASSKSSISIVKSKIKTYMSDYGKITWHYASTGLNDGVVIYPKLTDGKGNILRKKVSVTTSGGDTVTGYTGDGIFLGNNFDHNFIPINRGGYAIVKFAEDNKYLASSFKISF